MDDKRSSRGGKSQRREKKKKIREEKGRRKRIRGEKGSVERNPGAPNEKKNAKHGVFPMFWVSGGSKVGSLKWRARHHMVG